MAEAKAPTASYLPGEDLDTLEANRRYQEALSKLTESLDSRKNRFFDPTLLAMAQGFWLLRKQAALVSHLATWLAKSALPRLLLPKRSRTLPSKNLQSLDKGLSFNA